MSFFSHAAAAALLSAAVMADSHVPRQFVMYTPGGDDTSVQRMDPILFPGQVSPHVHQFFGGSALSDEVSYDSLQNSECSTFADNKDRSNSDDNSIYWHPSLYMEAKDSSGYIRVPTNGHKIYYKDAGSEKDQKRDPFEFPHGFRMLAGDPFLRAAPFDRSRQNITQWICHVLKGKMNQGTDGGFPNQVDDCADVDGFNGAIHFPHCWNENDFDPAHPGAHVAYPEDNIQDGKCPSTHPIRLPHLFLENTFDIHKVYDLVKPDSFVLAQGDNTGYGWHADFFNGWKDGALTRLLSCPQTLAEPNENVGTCPGYNYHTTKASKCNMTTTYFENVDRPGKLLPGCNPLSTTNPAPKYAPAPLNVATDTCDAASIPPASNGASSSVSSSAAPTTSPMAQSSSSAPAAISSSTSFSMSSRVPSTTFLTVPIVKTVTSTSSSATPATQTHTPASHQSVSCPAANGTTFASHGALFQIECGIDHRSGDLGMKQVQGGLAACIEVCATTPGCVDVSLSGVACYMKKSVGATLVDHGISGARLVAPASASSEDSSPTFSALAHPSYDAPSDGAPAQPSYDASGDDALATEPPANYKVEAAQSSYDASDDDAPATEPPANNEIDESQSSHVNHVWVTEYAYAVVTASPTPGH